MATSAQGSLRRLCTSPRTDSCPWRCAFAEQAILAPGRRANLVQKIPTQTVKGKRYVKRESPISKTVAGNVFVASTQRSLMGRVLHVASSICSAMAPATSRRRLFPSLATPVLRGPASSDACMHLAAPVRLSAQPDTPAHFASIVHRVTALLATLVPNAWTCMGSRQASSLLRCWACFA